MKLAILLLATSGGFWSDTAPRRPVRAERLVTPSGMPDVFVVYDVQNKTMCHITHSSEGGGGIFCQPLPQGAER